jgi:hypothetical protein
MREIDAMGALPKFLSKLLIKGLKVIGLEFGKVEIANYWIDY